LEKQERADERAMLGRIPGKLVAEVKATGLEFRAPVLLTALFNTITQS